MLNQLAKSFRTQRIDAKMRGPVTGSSLHHTLGAAIVSIALSTSPVHADVLEKPQLPETVYFGNGCFVRCMNPCQSLI